MAKDIKIHGGLPASLPATETPAPTEPRVPRASAAAVAPALPADRRDDPRPVRIELRPRPSLPGLPPSALADGKDAVPVTLYWDDPLQSPVTVRLPPSALGWKDGKPVLVGPRVRIVIENEADLGLPQQIVPFLPAAQRTVPLSIAPVEADDQGRLSPEPSGRGLGQTTPYVAAHQVITLVERATGRRVLWGEAGQLAIEPYALVSPLSTDLNAFFLPALRSVRLGSLAAVENGQLREYSGSGVDFIDYTLADARREAIKLEHEIAELEPEDPERAQLEGILTARRWGIDRLEELQAKFVGRQPKQEELVELAQKVANTEPPRETTSALEGVLSFFSGAAGRAKAAAWVEEMQGVVAVIVRASAATDMLNPVDRALVELPKSREVSAHEAAHAALNTLKPGLRTVTGRAFHEAYGDLVAFWTAFDRPETIDAWIDETDGDLHASSSVSRMGEQFRRQIAAATKDTSDDHLLALRDLSEKKRLSDFPGVTLNTLVPADVTANEAQHADDEPDSTSTTPSHEPHVLSQLISSTLYELFADEASEAILMPDDESTRAAVLDVRARVAELVHKSLLFVPEDGGTLRDLVAALRHTNELFHLVDPARLDGILEERELLTDAPPTATLELPLVHVAPGASSAALRTAMAGQPFQRALEKLAAETGLELVLEEDWPDDRGYRVLRFRGEVPGAGAITDAMAEQYGAHAMDAFKPRASLVLDDQGNLVALHPLAASTSMMTPAGLEPCRGFH